jgi:hypothetical protein
MNITQTLNKLMENNTLVIVVSIIVALYSALIAPALPNSVIRFFDTLLGKLIFIFLIAYVSSKNIQVALLISIGFVLTLQLAYKLEAEHFENPEPNTVNNPALEKMICNFVNTLSLVSDPKKQDVEAMLVPELVEKHHAELIKIDNSFTKDMLIDATKTDFYKNKNVKDLCANVASAEMFDDYENAVANAEKVRQECGDQFNCLFPPDSQLKNQKFLDMCKKMNIDPNTNKGKRFKKDGKTLSDAALQFRNECSKIKAAADAEKILSKSKTGNQSTSSSTNESSKSTTPAKQTTTESSKPMTPESNSESSTPSSNQQSQSNQNTTASQSTEPQITEKYHNYEDEDMEQEPAPYMTTQVENFDNYSVVPSNNYFDNMNRMMYAPLQV